MSGTGGHPDQELLAAARLGDHSAWAELARRHAPRLAAYLGARLRRPEIVDGLVGEALVAAWLRLAEAPDAGECAAWLRKIGGGLAMKWAREHPDAAIESPIPPGRLQSTSAVDITRLDQRIGLLDESQRMALELRWRAGMDDAALASAMRCSEEAARRMADEAEERLVREWDA